MKRKCRQWLRVMGVSGGTLMGMRTGVSLIVVALVMSGHQQSLNANEIGLSALYEQVPVERVLRNLEVIVAAEPQNVEARVNLARAHAMAYATKSETLNVSRLAERAGAAGPLPRPIVAAAASIAVARSDAHLRDAVASYEAALALDPNEEVALLGYGWCLEQMGEKERAIAAYRAVVALVAWPLNPPLQIEALGYSSEAAGYLIPLLDSVKDATEIASLKSRIEAFEKRLRMISPIVVPLSRDAKAQSLVDDTRAVRFDADGRALGGTWTWISRDAAWLVFDKQGQGQIDSALQLFGNATFFMFWRNGYEALRALDDDHDGTLKGKELEGLALWHDVNGNGRSDAGEVRPLAEWGIVSVSCRYVADEENGVYIASSAAGVAFADGTTRPTYDVLLRKVKDP
jgi:tetratricopeptide (TPR) repeat protein